MGVKRIPASEVVASPLFVLVCLKASFLGMLKFLNTFLNTPKRRLLGLLSVGLLLLLGLLLPFQKRSLPFLANSKPSVKPTAVPLAAYLVSPDYQGPDLGKPLPEKGSCLVWDTSGRTHWKPCQYLADQERPHVCSGGQWQPEFDGFDSKQDSVMVYTNQEQMRSPEVSSLYLNTAYLQESLPKEGSEKKPPSPRSLDWTLSPTTKAEGEPAKLAQRLKGLYGNVFFFEKETGYAKDSGLGYQFWLTHPKLGRQRLLELQDIENPLVRVLWIGDLDQDSLMDIYIQAPVNLKGSDCLENMLFVSSKRVPGNVVGWIATTGRRCGCL
jgi:hypothetical protein